MSGAATEQQKPSAEPLLADIFTRFASSTQQDIPELKGRFIVVDVSSQKIYGDVDIAKTKFSSENAVKNFINLRSRDSKGREVPTFATYYPGHNLAVVYFNGPLGREYFAKPDGGTERNVTGILDHELGHLMVKNALSPGNSNTLGAALFQENAADIYAVLKHMKRYGADKAPLETLTFHRAYALAIKGDLAHFSALALEELGKLPLDIGKMSHSDMTQLSGSLAAAHTPRDFTAKNLAKEFAQAAQALEKTGNIELALREIAEASLKDSASAGALRVGNIILSRFFSNALKYDGAPVELKGAYWDGVKEKLKGRVKAPAP